MRLACVRCNTVIKDLDLCSSSLQYSRLSGSLDVEHLASCIWIWTCETHGNGGGWKAELLQGKGSLIPACSWKTPQWSLAFLHSWDMMGLAASLMGLGAKPLSYRNQTAFGCISQPREAHIPDSVCSLGWFHNLYFHFCLMHSSPQLPDIQWWHSE